VVCVLSPSKKKQIPHPNNGSGDSEKINIKERQREWSLGVIRVCGAMVHEDAGLKPAATKPGQLADVLLAGAASE
jgi:hypothetical protein